MLATTSQQVTRTARSRPKKEPPRDSGRRLRAWRRGARIRVRGLRVECMSRRTRAVAREFRVATGGVLYAFSRRANAAQTSSSEAFRARSATSV